jgi:hypothetical protein
MSNQHCMAEVERVLQQHSGIGLVDRALRLIQRF